MSDIKKKVVLAFSGGLDTTFCALYLREEKNLEVHTVLVNTGGFSTSELDQVEETAKNLGVASHMNIDKTQEFYRECIRYMIFGNVLRNNTYPLSVSAERVFQAMAVANHAKEKGADYVAHGSTGAGNDQVRFDLVFQVMIPNVEILSPIRDLRLSRSEEVAYLEKSGVKKEWRKAKYSINKGLWGTSVGGAETLTSKQYLPEDAWPVAISKSKPELVELEFSKGEPAVLNGKKMSPVEIIQELDSLAAPFGIGRDIHVGDTIIGIKGRVGFQAAAPLLIIKAHQLLEKHILSKQQIYWKEQLANWYGIQLHEGQYNEPLMRNMEAFLLDTQKRVSGKVFIELNKHHYILQGIESDYDQMKSEAGQYGEINEGWTGDDVKSFTKIFGNSNKIYHSL